MSVEQMIEGDWIKVSPADLEVMALRGAMALINAGTKTWAALPEDQRAYWIYQAYRCLCGALELDSSPFTFEPTTPEAS